MLTGLGFSRVLKKFPVPGKKIPERENFGKLRTIHRYKIPWQQFVSQRAPHKGRCPTPGGIRWAASFRSQYWAVFANWCDLAVGRPISRGSAHSYERRLVKITWHRCYITAFDPVTYSLPSFVPTPFKLSIKRSAQQVKSLLGMLNNYWIFDYRIKCSFSISFVAHSIPESARGRPSERRWTVNRPHYVRRCRSGERTSSLWAARAVSERRLWRRSLLRCVGNQIFGPRPSADSNLRSANAYVMYAIWDPQSICV